MSGKKNRRLSLNAALAEAERTGAFLVETDESVTNPDGTESAVTETVTVAVADKPAKTKTPRWTPLDAERAAWIAKNARPAISPCLCGCGETTKGRFFPGHDATLKETLKVTVATGDEAAALSASDALTAFGW